MTKYLLIKPTQRVLAIPMASPMVQYLGDIFQVDVVWDSDAHCNKYSIDEKSSLDFEIVDDSYFTPALPVVDALNRELAKLRTDWCTQYTRAGKLEEELKAANTRLAEIGATAKG